MKALLIDGLNLVRRVFSAVPIPAEPARHDEAVMDSVLASLNRALVHHAPTHAVGVFDGKGASWRHRLFPRYKSERPPPPEALNRTLPAIIAAIEQVAGVKCVMQRGFEADDLLASSASKVATRGGRVVILSTDTSLCQMIGPRVTVHDHFSGRDLDEAFVRQRFGVAPDQLVELLALAGIQSSSIPGVKGIGPKTASRLLVEYGDLEGILKAAAEIPGRVGKLLVEGQVDARLSRQLVALATDIELGVNLSQFRLVESARRDATIAPHQA